MCPNDTNAPTTYCMNWWTYVLTNRYLYDSPIVLYCPLSNTIDMLSTYPVSLFLYAQMESWNHGQTNPQTLG